MATPKPQANITSSPDTSNARPLTDSELLFKRGQGARVSIPDAGHAVPWDTFRTNAELLAALPPLPASGPAGDDAAESMAHNPAPASDRRGAFVEQGNAGRSRVNRSGHKP